MYYEDVIEVFEVVLHKGSVGHVYNFGEEREGVLVMFTILAKRGKEV